IIKRIRQHRFYRKFFEEAGYDIIHIDTDDVGRADVLRCARRCGVKKRIYHAHNSCSEGDGILARVPVCRRVMQGRIARFSTDMLACSTEAAKWVYSDKYLTGVTIVKNGIDTEKFRFNSDSRSKIREKYGLENAYVMGCVARFAKQKNHGFLIDIFAEVVKKDPNAVLMLIGEGELKEEIQRKAEELQLADKVVFVGTTDEVQNYMSAMDIYVMPSLFEGLSLVFIEAQTSGLYCLASKNISPETKVCNRMEFLPLEESVAQWKEWILSEEVKVPASIRETAWRDVVNAGYDIKSASRQLLEIYQS
ncbi:MAG: glycosyltransferase, partial [Bacteroidales bacterium]|nr:glycosyltransferase [Bacteroidales bacterium]